MLVNVFIDNFFRKNCAVFPVLADSSCPIDFCRFIEPQNCLVKKLTLHHTILTFDDPEKEAF